MFFYFFYLYINTPADLLHNVLLTETILFALKIQQQVDFFFHNYSLLAAHLQNIMLLGSKHSSFSKVAHWHCSH